MATELTLDYRLRWNDFDRFGNIRPDSVLDIFQDLATLQAEDMGIGRDDMLKENCFWAVTRIKYEVFAQPQRDVVYVRTWPHTPTKLSFLRDFEMKDANGNLILKGTSEWVLMNAETRKFESVLEHYHGPLELCEDRAFESKPKKVKVKPLKDLKYNLIGIFLTNFSEIDINNHVNNAVYPRYILGALRLTENKPIRTFQIDYRHELTFEDEVFVYAEEADGVITVCGALPDHIIAFNCKIELG